MISWRILYGFPWFPMFLPRPEVVLVPASGTRRRRDGQKIGDPTYQEAGDVHVHISLYVPWYMIYDIYDIYIYIHIIHIYIYIHIIHIYIYISYICIYIYIYIHTYYWLIVSPNDGEKDTHTPAFWWFLWVFYLSPATQQDDWLCRFDHRDVRHLGARWKWECRSSRVPSGYLLHSHGKSPSLIGKSTINGPCSIAMLVYQRVKSFNSNVNPGLINHGLLMRGIPPIVMIWYLNGTFPIKWPRGLLIQGWHYPQVIYEVSYS